MDQAMPGDGRGQHSHTKPPIMMNVQSVRVMKLCLFLTCSLCSGATDFSGGFSMSFFRGARVDPFSDAEGSGSTAAGTSGRT